MEAKRETEKAGEAKASFPEAVMTREQWSECRRAVESGLEMKEAAAKFGIEYQTVKVRAWREKWLHDSRIKTLAEQVKAKEAAKVVSLLPPETVERKPALTASSAITETFESHRSQTLLNLAKLAGKGIQRAIDANLNIENWQDAKIAADIALKLHGVGEQGVQVNVLVGGDGGFDGPVIENQVEDYDVDELND
jgi:transposase-like protein